MSETIEQEARDLLRQKIIRATRAAAGADGVSVHADALALLSQPALFFVNAPIAELEELDLGSLLDGSLALDDTPVMYWYLSCDLARSRAMPIPEGYYTVIAHQDRGTASLRDPNGTTVSAGSLEICIEPQVQPAVAAKQSLSSGIDSVKRLKHGFKVCGHVTVSTGPVEVTIKVCIEVQA